MAKRELITYNDVTQCKVDRVEKFYRFHSVWLTNPLELQKFYSSPANESRLQERDLGRLDHQEKIAVSRHEKALEIRLGLREEEKPTRKLIYINTTKSLLVDNFIEKEKVFISPNDGVRINKENDTYAEFTEENKKLLDQFHQKIKEAEEIKNKLFGT